MDYIEILMILAIIIAILVIIFLFVILAKPRIRLGEVKQKGPVDIDPDGP